MIINQQSLNEVIEMQDRIQETGEIMVYLTSVKLQKDISQINKQFQGTLMNKVIPRDLYEFFHSKVKMDKDRYEKEINSISDSKAEKTKYMQTLSVIYKLLLQYNLGKEYIEFLMNFINRRPDYTKVNAVILMYRMRLTGIIMLEHYLQYKNGNTDLYDFNNVWNSLYSKIVEFNRKHQQQKINFAEQTSVVNRCESIIKQYIEEQKQFEESQNSHSNLYKQHIRPTGLKINTQDLSEQKFSLNQSVSVAVKSNINGQQEINESKVTLSNGAMQNKTQTLQKISMQIDQTIESTPFEVSSRMQQQHQSLNQNNQNNVEKNYLKEMQNVNNDIEQEVSILIKVHYMHHLNISMPFNVVDFMDQQKKEAYLQIFYDWKKMLSNKIEEIGRNMEILRGMQSQLYEIFNPHTNTITQPKQKNQKSYLDQCKKMESQFPFVIKKLDEQLKVIQKYVRHYDQSFSNKLQMTYHYDSQPITYGYDNSKVTNIELVQESIDENETGISLEETKVLSTLNDSSTFLSNKSKQLNGNTLLQNQTESIMTRNKSKQIKNNSQHEVKENAQQSSTQTGQNSKKGKTRLNEELDNRKNINNNYAQSQMIVIDPYQNAKSQYNEKMKASSSLESNKNVIKEDMKENQSNQDSIRQSKFCFNFNNNLKNILQSEKLLNLTNNEQKQIFKSDQQNKEKSVFVQSDYEELQDKFKQHHFQLKQLNERYRIYLEEFEDMTHHLKTYLFTHCFVQLQDSFLEVQNATSSQIKKCVYFLEANQSYSKQIDFIEDQFLHFPYENDLDEECFDILKKKLKVSKQIVYNSDNQDKYLAQQKKSKQPKKIINDLNNSMVQEESYQISHLQEEPQTNESNYSYINSLKNLYQPCSNAMQLFSKQNQVNKEFQAKFYDDSKILFNKMFVDGGYKMLKAPKINQLIKNDDYLKSLFSS